MAAVEFVTGTLFALALAAVLAGAFWWIPTYISPPHQAFVKQWAFASLSIVAVVLNLGRDWINGDRSIRFFTVLVLTILTIVVSVGVLYGVVSIRDQPTKQDTVLLAMSIVLTVINLVSELVRVRTAPAPILVPIGGRRR
jgi:hypothetical protein